MKTKIINNVEYEIETHHFNKTLDEIKIPNGWRLWTIEECTNFYRDPKNKINFNLSNCWFFIKTPFNSIKEYIQWFDEVKSWTFKGDCSDPATRDIKLGVRFCRDLKNGNDI